MRKIPSVLNSTHVNSFGEGVFPSIQAIFQTGLLGYQSYQVVPACIMNHPALLHHRGAPPLGVFDGLDHPHQRDVAAGGGAGQTRKKKENENQDFVKQCDNYLYLTCNQLMNPLMYILLTTQRLVGQEVNLCFWQTNTTGNMKRTLLV